MHLYFQFPGVTFPDTPLKGEGGNGGMKKGKEESRGRKKEREGRGG